MINQEKLLAINMKQGYLYSMKNFFQINNRKREKIKRAENS